MKFDRKKFKNIRCKLMWSISKTANELGVTRKTIYNWEKGIAVPDEKKIFKIANVFGIAPHMITDLEESKANTNIDLKKTAQPLLAILKDKSDHNQEINYASSVLKKLNQKLNDAFLIILAIIESMNFPIYIKDNKQNFLVVNKTFLEYTGIDTDPPDTSGNSDYTYFHKKDADSNFREDSKVILTRQPVINREDYIPGTKKKKWGLINKVPIIDETDNVAGVIGVFVDITDRKTEEKKRKELEKINARLGKLIEIFNRVIAYKEFDPVTNKYNTSYINNEIKNIAGIEPKELIKNDAIWLEQIVHPEDRSKRTIHFKSTKYPKILTYRIINRETKEIKWVYEMFYKNNNIIYYAMKDITSEKVDSMKLNSLTASLNKLDTAVAFVDKAPNNSYIYISDNYEKIYGYPKENFLDENFLIDTCVHQDDKARLKNYTKTYWPKQTQYRIIRPDGIIRWIQRHDIPKNNAEKFHTIISRDITDKRLREEQNTDIKIKELLKKLKTLGVEQKILSQASELPEEEIKAL